jgi:hypothetical protein
VNAYRLADAVVAKFDQVKSEYRKAGCCVRACEDLASWVFTSFGAQLEGVDVHLVFLVNGNVSKAPVLYADPGQGGEATPKQTRLDVTKLFKRGEGTCVWSFDRKKTVVSAAVYSHRVVRLNNVFVDWGFDQFLLPVGTEVFLAM